MPPNDLIRICAFALALAACSAGCTGASRAPAPPRAGACTLLPAETSSPSGTVVIGVRGPLDPARAPMPASAGEQIAFGQLYHTMVRVDCYGRAAPLLAEAWTAEVGGRRWIFQLRRDARDWEGQNVTAAHVVESWGALGPADVPEGNRFVRLIASDTRTVVVELAAPAEAAFFAEPALGVRTAATGAKAGQAAASWPTGTGPYRPAASAASSGELVLNAVAAGSRLVLRTYAGDGRDALDGGADLLVTADRGVIDYALSIGFGAVPLPWDVRYLLAVPVRPGRAAPAPYLALASLARDAVPVDARPVPAGLPEACSAPIAVEAFGTQEGFATIAYRADDPVARALAERLVALASEDGWVRSALRVRDGSQGQARAVALSARAFADAIGAADDTAFVVGEPINRGCGSASAIPLIETRRTLLYRAGIGGVDVDGAGTLLLDAVHPGRAAGDR